VKLNFPDMMDLWPLPSQGHSRMRMPRIASAPG